MHQHGDLLHSLLDSFGHAAGISLFVFLMMVVVDYLNVFTNGKLTSTLKAGRFRQYTWASLLGSVPGCLGSFLVITLYLRQMLSFGAVVGCLAATAGDASFIMLAEIPETALLLFGILFLCGIVLGFVSDLIANRLKITPVAVCHDMQHYLGYPDCSVWPENGLSKQFASLRISRLLYLVVLALSAVTVSLGWIGPESFNWIRIAILALLSMAIFVLTTVPDHYLTEHINNHITKHHLPRIFIWTLGTLLALSVLEHFVHLEEIVENNMVWVLLMAALVGIIPDSGPHLIFVFLFANGTIPFSVLLTSSLVQDGHGLLPLLSVSLKDSVLVKIFNLVAGLIIGGLVFLCGY